MPSPHMCLTDISPAALPTSNHFLCTSRDVKGKSCLKCASHSPENPSHHLRGRVPRRRRRRVRGREQRAGQGVREPTAPTDVGRFEITRQDCDGADPRRAIVRTHRGRKGLALPGTFAPPQYLLALRHVRWRDGNARQPRVVRAGRSRLCEPGVLDWRAHGRDREGHRNRRRSGRRVARAHGLRGLRRVESLYPLHLRTPGITMKPKVLAVDALYGEWSCTGTPAQHPRSSVIRTTEPRRRLAQENATIPPNQCERN